MTVLNDLDFTGLPKGRVTLSLSKDVSPWQLPKVTGGQGGRRRAFSLVEVAIAIAVTSFAISVLMALIPLGMNLSRQAGVVTTQSQIVQYSRNELEMTSFTNISAWNTTTTYFNNQGLPTTSNDPLEIYTVTFSVGNVGLSINGGTTNSFLGPNSNLTNAAGATVADAQSVQIRIVDRTLPPGQATNLYTVVIPNAGF